MQWVITLLAVLAALYPGQSGFGAEAPENAPYLPLRQNTFPINAFPAVIRADTPVCWDMIIGDKLGHPACAPRVMKLPVFYMDNQKYSARVNKNRSSVQEFQQSPLISVLKGVFKDEGVPDNLVWLVEVESSFKPEVESAAGAMGLFQLMPATAQRFGLQVSPVDDRKVPLKSAKAAASYLRYLRNEFGCWTLALAAYNAGEGRVSQALRGNGARNFHDVARYLPSETRRYVPRVMATMALREDQLDGVPAACFKVE